MPIRTAKQIEGTRGACLIARQILDKASAGVRPGITTDEVDRIVSSLLLSQGMQHGVTCCCDVHGKRTFGADGQH